MVDGVEDVAMLVVLLACAGAVGAVCRYGIAVAVGPLATPWATLGINVTGSFLLGLLVGVVPVPDSTVRVVLGTGFLGAFTTFSTFSVEIVALARDGRIAVAGLYVAASLLLGVAAAGAGLLLAQQIT